MRLRVLATFAALFSATAAQAATFTPQECGVIAEVSAATVRALGANTMSLDFRKSLMAFIGPGGQSATCTGPTNILTPLGRDIDAFNTIRGVLLQARHPISLQAAGLRSVDPAELAASRP